MAQKVKDWFTNMGIKLDYSSDITHRPMDRSNGPMDSS